MRQHLLHAVLSLGLMLAGWSAQAAEADPQSSAIQTVISSQIEAFGRDDAATAHSFAAPAIQQMFPDAGKFLGMVKQSYGALIRPRSTRFEPVDANGTGATQKVTIVDSDGVLWTALYTLQQVDGQWRITGCALLKSPDVGA